MWKCVIQDNYSYSSVQERSEAVGEEARTSSRSALHFRLKYTKCEATMLTMQDVHEQKRESQIALRQLLYRVDLDWHTAREHDRNKPLVPLFQR